MTLALRGNSYNSLLQTAQRGTDLLWRGLYRLHYAHSNHCSCSILNFWADPAAMSSNASSMPPSKGASIPTQLPSPSQSQAPSTLPSIDRQRRSGSSFGAAASSRALIASPRNNQSSRKQNKASKRPKLGYDDMSEAAAMRSSRKGQTSITHLMNFTLPPRPQNYSHFNYHHGYRSSGGRRQYNWGYNVADKAR